MSAGTFDSSLPVIGHVAVEGWSDIANGAIHPLFNPAQILVVLGLALLLGRQQPLRVRRPMWVFMSAVAIALGLTLAGASLGAPVPVLTGLSLCLGTLIAIGWQIPDNAIYPICLVAGVSLGLDSGVESGGAVAIAKTFTGTWLGLGVLVAYVALASSNASGKKWAETGVRVIGSWIVAISLLVLAFSLKEAR